MLTEDHIRQALRDCYDASHPYRKPCNIVDLGLISSIALAIDPEAPGAGIPGVPARHVVSLTLLSPSDDEAAQAMLSALVANRLAGLPEVWRTEVVLAPGWTPAHISPAGRQLLALDFPILNNRGTR
jgi:metal-sulfur cluster biosynthetic enzyme